jgi:hypothetical protein
MKNKTGLLWLTLPILAILVILSFRQYGTHKATAHPSAQKPENAIAQIPAASPVAPPAKTCLQQPIETADGDFSPVDISLRCLLTEYKSAAERSDDKRIAELDIELKELVKLTKSLHSYDAWNKFWLDRDQSKSAYWEMLGVVVGEHGLQYGGDLRYNITRQNRIRELAKFEPYRQRFDQIKAEYLAVPKTSDISNIEHLYKMDEQLEKLVAEIVDPPYGMDPLPDYQEIGVTVANGIHYDGRIRSVADKLLPPQGFIDPKSGKRITVQGDRYSALKQKLEDIYTAYGALQQRPEDADALYELSREISSLMDKIHKAYPFGRSKAFWDDKYEKLGMYIGHYSDQLDYGGKLLVDSYRLNPDSRYGEATLFAAISGGGNMSELSGIPDMKLVETYLKKYPDGKHIVNVYVILATFYQNLFEELLAGKESPAIAGCYDEYLAAHPEDGNKEAAQKKAIGYYRKLLSINQSGRERYTRALGNLEKGVDENIRYWCTD